MLDQLADDCFYRNANCEGGAIAVTVDHEYVGELVVESDRLVVTGDFDADDGEALAGLLESGLVEDVELAGID